VSKRRLERVIDSATFEPGGMARRHGHCRGKKACCLVTGFYEGTNDTDNTLVKWINHTCKTNFATLKDASGGAAACQIIDIIRPNFAITKQEWRSVNWIPSACYHVVENLSILGKAFERLNIEKSIPIKDLSWQRMVATREFYRWLKQYHASSVPMYHSSKYNEHERRKLCKNGQDFEQLMARNEARMHKTIMPKVVITHQTFSKIDRRTRIVWQPRPRRRPRVRDSDQENFSPNKMGLGDGSNPASQKNKSRPFPMTPLSNFIAQFRQRFVKRNKQDNIGGGYESKQLEFSKI
jgi:hypothetical protein